MPVNHGCIIDLPYGVKCVISLIRGIRQHSDSDRCQSIQSARETCAGMVLLYYEAKGTS